MVPWNLQTDGQFVFAGNKSCGILCIGMASSYSIAKKVFEEWDNDNHKNSEISNKEDEQEAISWSPL
jgi:hypothetical protein